jgi:hypothetical protein
MCYDGLQFHYILLHGDNRVEDNHHDLHIFLHIHAHFHKDEHHHKLVHVHLQIVEEAHELLVKGTNEEELVEDHIHNHHHRMWVLPLPYPYAL